MKILRGSLTETRYEFPEEGSKDSEEMKVISKKRYEENQVAYMADELGLHRIANEGSDFAVSLHREFAEEEDATEHRTDTCPVYTPPNVAREGCNIFDEKTGRSSHVPGCHYFSAYGRLLKQ